PGSTQPNASATARSRRARAPTLAHSDAHARRAGRSAEVELSLPVGNLSEDPAPAEEEPSPWRRSAADRPLYKVRSGETLRSIARNTLGDPHRDVEILELNREAVRDPFRLTPGQTLVLPDDAQLAR